ncbi:Uncharacterized protein GBIM_04420 [Gryllus bimaculatus]|nr:Uncharacterized protein GBIM_04420 [Gryllus bimaculatus]
MLFDTWLNTVVSCFCVAVLLLLVLCIDIFMVFLVHINFISFLNVVVAYLLKLFVAGKSSYSVINIFFPVHPILINQGAKHILAIDVGSQDDTDLTNYGDCLSGWWLLWKRWNPFASPVKVPNLPDIQSRLAYVSCVRQLEEVKTSDYCEYIRPPIDKYKTLQFGSFDEIKEVGYQHGTTYFAGMLKAGALPLFKTEKSQATSKGTIQPSTYTFTDLAQMVCKVPLNQYIDESDSEEEYEADEEDAQEMGYASEPSAGILDFLTPEKLVLFNSKEVLFGQKYLSLGSTLLWNVSLSSINELFIVKYSNV